MKNSQSKFSNKKAHSGKESTSKSSSSVSGCCCGSHISEEIEETEVETEK